VVGWLSSSAAIADDSLRNHSDVDELADRTVSRGLVPGCGAWCTPVPACAE
jgi:hypothetical protein